jgi:hypothetical protein
MPSTTVAPSASASSPLSSSSFSQAETSFNSPPIHIKKSTRGKPKMLKQGEVREQVRVLGMEILQLQLLHPNLSKEQQAQLSFKVQAKADLEKKLNKLVLNQMRQQRHRERKKLKISGQTDKQIVEVFGEQTTISSSSTSEFSSLASSVQPKLHYSQQEFSSQETTTSEQQHFVDILKMTFSQETTDVDHGMFEDEDQVPSPKPDDDGENTNDSGLRDLNELIDAALGLEVFSFGDPRIRHFTPSEWSDLEASFPILKACPLIGDGDSQASLLASEQVFLQRILTVLDSKVPQCTRDVSLMVNIRQLFLKECSAYGPVVARFFLYLMVVHRRHLTEQEKRSYAESL